ncbi:hypothetical protein [Spirosoma pollinicola]|nr:hypothetical protein [Spirosoma pollinicola]
MDFNRLQHYLVHEKGYSGRVRGSKFGLTSTTAMAFDYQCIRT